MPITFPEYSIAFGITSIVFGFIGYARAKSNASLIAGGISGVLLVLGGYLARGGGDNYKLGFWLAFIVSILLLGRFLPTFLKTRRLYPGGILALLAAIGVVLGTVTLIR